METNYKCCDNGRVWVILNSVMVKVNKIMTSSQNIHYKIIDINKGSSVFTSFVYASNLQVDKRSL